MVSARKFIPFALAAGMMAGTAQADDHVTHEQFPADAFGCTQVVYKFPSGTYRHTAECPNVAGSILIANHARAQMDWRRAFTENEKILAAGITERPVIEGLLESALMRGRLDDAVWAANVAAVQDVVTPQSMLINAVRAARANDVQGMLSELLYLPVDGRDPANLYVNNLAYMVETAIHGGPDGSAMEILTQALADTEAMIGEQVAAVVAREGAVAESVYAPFTEAALLLRRGTEVLANPNNDEARRTLAQYYTARDADPAALEMMRGMAAAPDESPVIVPIPAPVPR